MQLKRLNQEKHLKKFSITDFPMFPAETVLTDLFDTVSTATIPVAVVDEDEKATRDYYPRCTDWRISRRRISLLIVNLRRNAGANPQRNRWNYRLNRFYGQREGFAIPKMIGLGGEVNWITYYLVCRLQIGLIMVSIGL